MGAFVGAQFLFSDKLALRSMGASEAEDDEAYWYPLWPESSRGHPWDQRQ